MPLVKLLVFYSARLLQFYDFSKSLNSWINSIFFVQLDKSHFNKELRTVGLQRHTSSLKPDMFDMFPSLIFISPKVQDSLWPTSQKV